MIAIRRGWFHLATGAGVGRVLGFASNLLLSRWLGPSELGQFNLVTTTVQTTDTLVRCGGDYALNFELGGHPEATKTEHGAELARGLAQLCSLATAVICIAVGIWVWCGQGLFSGLFVPRQRFILTVFLLLMIAFEGCTASAWELLLVSHRTVPLALRQGLFVPLRFFFAALGALIAGVCGAMGGWCLIAVVQFIWLKTILRNLWNPLRIWPFLGRSINRLLRRGFTFYAVNLLAAVLFYPLLFKVAAASGLSEIGYLRAGQILQQLFAFLPSTLVPILFLKLRSESNLAAQVSVVERPMRLIWLLLIEVLLIYCMLDDSLIILLFGSGFGSALLPTRILLMTSLFECLSQLVVQPLLAAGRIGTYGFWQNGSALLAAFLGWLWIPTAGLSAYLIVRLIYVILPLTAYSTSLIKELHEPRKMLPLVFTSTALLILLIIQSLYNITFDFMPILFAIFFLIIGILQRNDIVLLKQALWSVR